MTAAVAQAIAVSLSREARDAWLAQRHVPASRADAERQDAALGRLAARFPGAVKVMH